MNLHIPPCLVLVLFLLPTWPSFFRFATFLFRLRRLSFHAGDGISRFSLQSFSTLLHLHTPTSLKATPIEEASSCCSPFFLAGASLSSRFKFKKQSKSPAINTLYSLYRKFLFGFFSLYRHSLFCRSRQSLCFRIYRNTKSTSISSLYFFNDFSTIHM